MNKPTWEWNTETGWHQVTPAKQRLPRPLKAFVIIALVVSLALLFGTSGQAPQSDADGLPIVRIAMAQTTEASYADYLCDGVDDHVQWQAAVNALTTGGKVEDLCGTEYNFGQPVTLPTGDICIQGVGGKTVFINDGATDIFRDGGFARCLFKDMRTDGGNITCTGTDSYRQNVWIGTSSYYFEGPSGSGAGGNVTQEDVEDWAGGMVTGNTETRITVTYDDPTGKLNFVVDDMNDDVPESGDFGNAADLDADGSITDGVIDEADLDVDNAPVDEYVLTYEASTGHFEWEADAGGAGGGGDDVFVDGGNVTDPDFVSTGDIDFVDVANTISANINTDSITVSMLADEDWGDVSVSGNTVSLDSNVVGTGEISDGTLLEADLKVVDAPVDEQILTYEATVGDFEWHYPYELITAGDFLTWATTTLNVDTANVTDGDNTHLVSADDIFDFCETTQDYLKTSENSDLAAYWWTLIPTSGSNETPSGNTTLYLQAGSNISITGYGNDTIEFAFTGNTTDDDVTLADVQSALSNDFHNVGGAYWWTLDVPSGTDETPSGNATLHLWAGTDISITGYGNNTVQIAYTGTGGAADFWWTWDAPLGVDLIPSGNSTVYFWGDPYLDIIGHANNTIQFDFTGDLTLDDVTLADVQTATSSDFHNIGGDYWWLFDVPTGTDEEPSGNSTLHFWAGTDISITGYGNDTIQIAFTGTTTDDDLTDNSIEDLSDVAAMAQALGDLLYYNGAAWDRLAAGSGYLASNGSALVWESITLGANTTGNYVLTLSEGEGIDIAGADAEGSTKTISGEDASTTNKGIAVFDADDFTVSSGNVSLAYKWQEYILTSCGSTANATNPPVSMYTDVTFGGFTMCVCEFAAGDVIGWSAHLPDDFASDGNTTLYVDVSGIADAASSGNAVWQFRAGDTIAGCVGASWTSLTTWTWTANDEAKLAGTYVPVTIAGSPAANDKVYFEAKLSSETLDDEVYLDQIIVKYHGE